VPVNSRRTVIVIAAVIIAAIAGVATVSYLNTVQDRANKNAKLVKVYTVKKDVAKGFPGDQAVAEGYIVSSDIPEKFRPATSVTDLNTLKGKVALTTLSANQVLVDGQFVDPKVEQISFAQRIPAGQVAITLSYDAVHAVAGLLVPGDKVDMIVIDPKDGSHRFLFQNVNILAIGTTAAPQAGEAVNQTTPGTGTGLITFAVPAIAAEKLARVGASAYLVLVPPDNQPAPIPPVNDANLFSGGLTPYE
jgi:pilus assembly protein CpaB